MIRSTAACALALTLLVSGAPAATQRSKPEVPDLTEGGQPDDKHDWNLGPTGARGWMWGWKLETTDARQILVTAVAEGSPADGALEAGDVLLGVGGAPFDGDPRVSFGEAVVAAEASGDPLEVLRWRAGEVDAVALDLPRLGRYSDTAPFDCEKSAAVLERACEHIAANMKGDIDGMVNALALLATGDRRYREAVADLAAEVAEPEPSMTLDGRTSGLFAWRWGYRNLFLCEYALATEDRSVMPAIAAYSGLIARGQSGVGTWGHGMAWPDLNDGEIHGRLGGYGALNQSGLICHLSLVLARRCGIDDPEVDLAIENANRFARFYVGKGAIPYGDHRPGWDVHDDNGKCSVAAIIFDLQGLDAEADFFARMAVASYAERERGHTGNYFSFLWGPLGAARAGDAAVAAFLREQRWYYDLARAHDGGFPYQGGAGMSGGEHKYGSWDCTGAFVLASTLPHRELYITGRDMEVARPLEGAALAETIAAGRGFDSWSMASDHYDAMDPAELVGHLESWSPAVRSRASKALAEKDRGDHVPTLLALMRSRSMEARYGACQALGALGGRAKDAVPALTEALESDDVWLRIQACYALAGIGGPARDAAPAMLRLALKSDDADPREFTQRYLAFCLFYPGGALRMRGVLSRDVSGIDRDLLYAAIERLLRNDDGRARGAVANAFELLDDEELRPLLPAIVEAVRTPSPSGVMFANGIRVAGLDVLARMRVAEGLPLCIDSMDIDEWGKQDRILGGLRALQAYGGAAKGQLGRLRELRARLGAHREAKNMPKQLELCDETIALIEAAENGPEARPLSELVPRSRRR